MFALVGVDGQVVTLADADDDRIRRMFVGGVKLCARYDLDNVRNPLPSERFEVCRDGGMPIDVVRRLAIHVVPPPFLEHVLRAAVSDESRRAERHASSDMDESKARGNPGRDIPPKTAGGSPEPIKWPPIPGETPPPIPGEYERRPSPEKDARRPSRNPDQKGKSF